MTYLNIDGWVFSTADIQLVGPVEADTDTGGWRVGIYLRGDPNPLFMDDAKEGDLNARREKLLAAWAGTCIDSSLTANRSSGPTIFSTNLS